MELNYFKNLTECNHWVPTIEEYFKDAKLSIEKEDDKELGELQYQMEGHKHSYQFISTHDTEDVYALVEPLEFTFGPNRVASLLKSSGFIITHSEFHSQFISNGYEHLMVTQLTHKDKFGEEVAIMVGVDDGVAEGSQTIIFVTKDYVELMDKLLTEFIRNYDAAI